MLLSGLPVISTIPSSSYGTGGRSIGIMTIIPFKCWLTLIQSLRLHVLLSYVRDPMIIHTMHKDLMYKLREQFAVDVLGRIFDEHNDLVSPVELLCGSDCYGDFRQRHKILAEGHLIDVSEVRV